MSIARPFVRSGLLAWFLAACATPPPPPPAAPVAPPPPQSTILKVVALSDFHGWLLPTEPKDYPKYQGGIANIGGLWSEVEKLDPNHSLILDNGDMWTGPTESTVLRGEPVIAAYNALGMAAANVANHEFDFGIEVLKARIQQAKFPFLGANIVEAGTDNAPPWVKPYTIVERGGFKVAVIGLSYVGTPFTTLAKNVAGLAWKPYAETLPRVVKEVKEKGAEVIVVLFHDTLAVVSETLTALPRLGVHAVVAGQNHRIEGGDVGGVKVVNPGMKGWHYVRFDIEVDNASRTVKSVDAQVIDVTGDTGKPVAPPRADLLAIVEEARQKSKALTGEVLGAIEKPLPIGSFSDSPLGHMVTDAWLAAFPNADLAICNYGGLRQPLAKGNVTLGDLLGVLPWENNLFIVKLTGKQLKDQLVIDGPVVSGITWKYREKAGVREVVAVVDKNGKPIDDAASYRIVINDFMYGDATGGGDKFTFRDFDAAPEDTGLSIREPVIRVLRGALASGKPLSVKGGARGAKVK
ncbi:MAG: bifunctional metallophosphatase/5'-nucleotidase [Deltaproteobacteria bacterium]|nr:bifunctional metallophosphatase/5'-nucleotidase [Deltaproteobacteria bacterium]